MPEPNFPNRTLAIMDNLEFLRGKRTFDEMHANLPDSGLADEAIHVAKQIGR